MKRWEAAPVAGQRAGSLQQAVAAHPLELGAGQQAPHRGLLHPHHLAHAEQGHVARDT